MGHRRLAEVEAEGPAGPRLVVLVETPDDLQPMRVAEGVQNGRQLDLASFGVMWLHVHQLSLYDSHRTSLVRCSSYYQTNKKATDMPDTQTLETQSATPERKHESDVHRTTTSRRAAAIEAAYILEAVRK
jgi:hypothetical protein